MDIKEARRRARVLRAIRIQIESYKRTLELIKNNILAKDIIGWYEDKIKELELEIKELEEREDELHE